MVMRHVLYLYTCVIVGWDGRCEAGEQWVAQMNINSLSRKTEQPFYQVLVSDGTIRYAAEENLKPETSDCWVKNCEVGRYLDTFDGRRYLPNAELLHAYPDDPPVAEASVEKPTE